MITSDKTLYTATDETGTQTTITLDKDVADALHREVHDIHAWVQDTFNRVTQKRPRDSRRKRGDFVRLLARHKAEKSPHFRNRLLQML